MASSASARSRRWTYSRDALAINYCLLATRLEPTLIHALDRHPDRLAHLFAEVVGRAFGLFRAVVALRQALDVGLRRLLVLPIERAGADDRDVACAILHAEGGASVTVQVPIL